MKNKKNNNRSFGLLFFVVFLIIGLYPVYNENNPNIYFIILSLPFLVVGLLDSKILTPFNKAWIKLGEFIKEFWEFLMERKKYWLLPIIIVLALFGVLIVLSQGSAVAPFIYTIF